VDEQLPGSTFETPVIDRYPVPISTTKLGY
jgi:hypothetical protein